MDPREDRHRQLLMDISNEMIVDSQEYVNFIFWMEGYVPKGILHENKSLLEKLQAVETAGHLKAGSYEALKYICEKSGNLNLIDLIEKAEKDINEIGTSSFETEADLKEPPAKKMKYTDTERDLQSDLIEYYRERCSTIPICPCLDEVDAPLMKVYIPPYPLYSQETDKMKQMFKQEKQEKFCSQETDKMKQMFKQEKKQETETSIHSLHEIFNKRSEECRNIYLTAEPGLGKTSFVKWLALNWCQAHSPKNDECCHFEHNEVGQMEHFEFLFLIFLRETDETERHIDSMIQNHIACALGRKSAYTPELLETVMCNKKCLLILDGLDEWPALGIPKRSTRKNCTYLTTSRPWKFCMLPLDSTQIDQHVCIKNVEKMCEKNLLLSIFSLIEQRKCLRDGVSNPDNACRLFRKMLKEKKITHFYDTPVILVQLIYLWNITKEIGNSQCEIYSDVVDTLFSIAEKKVELLDRFKDKKTSSIKYFHDLSFCETYYDLMIKLGKLAFETLFSENKRSSLVFDEAVALKYLPADESTTADKILSACLQTGLLSKQLAHVRGRRKTYTYSFYHKTIQEYFAALYIQSEYGDNVHIKEVIRRSCNTVSMILEMGTVFMFLSGLCPCIAVEILQSLQTIINEDEMTQVYRCRLLKWWSEEQQQMKLIQDLVISCTAESAKSGHERQDFPLEDIIIGEDCNRGFFSPSLKTLINLNSNNIKSLAVLQELTDCSVLTDVWKYYEVSEMKYISQLQIDGAVRRKSYALQEINVSSQVPNIIDQVLELKAQQLESLHLRVSEAVTHSSLERFFHFVSHQTLLKNVDLTIECSEHIVKKCTGLQLHLCQHEHLQKLHLRDVPISEVQLNKHLQQLHLYNEPISELQLNEHLQQLHLWDVPISELQLNEHLQALYLDNVPISELQLNKHLQQLYLYNVPISELQVNKHLQQLLLCNAPISELQLNEHLQELDLRAVNVSELQLNEHLQKLTLANVNVSQLLVNKQLQFLDLYDVSRSQCQGYLSSLVYCDVSHLPDGFASALFRCLPAKLQTLKCEALESPDVMVLLDTVAKLLQLESIALQNMDLGERALLLSNNMEHIRHVVIDKVTLTSNALNSLVASVIRYKQFVKVELKEVTVKDSSTGVEQETVNQDCLNSGRDNSCRNSRTEFELLWVKISSKAFRHFVEIVEKCQQPVLVKILAAESKDIVENYREGIVYVISSPSFIISFLEETSRRFTFKTGDQHGVI